MSWFTSKKATPMSTEITSGREAIRRAMLAMSRKENLAAVGRDLGVSATALEAFAASDAMLAPGILIKLAERLFMGHLTYDPVSDKIEIHQQAAGGSACCPAGAVQGPAAADRSPAGDPGIQARCQCAKTIRQTSMDQINGNGA